MLTPHQELQVLASGKYQRIVGIDEVGRGCWAGPLAVGAYVFTSTSPALEFIDDSKNLSPKLRESVYGELKSHDYQVLFASVPDIDSDGVTKATQRLILELIKRFSDGTTLIWVDGRFKCQFGENVETIIDGDANYYSIAAASILAKVERDRLMAKLDRDYPGYSFSKHKGYGTKQHIQAISSLGVCDLHRRSFTPIRNYI